MAEISGYIQSRIRYENGIPHLWYYYRICRNAHVIWAVFTTTMPVVTKIGRVVTYHEGLPFVKSRDILITWSYGIT